MFISTFSTQKSLIYSTYYMRMAVILEDVHLERLHEKQNMWERGYLWIMNVCHYAISDIKKKISKKNLINQIYLNKTMLRIRV